MPKTKEETKIVQRYEQKYENDLRRVAADVLVYDSGDVSISLDDGDGVPFGITSTMDREKAAALHKLLGEILKDHK